MKNRILINRHIIVLRVLLYDPLISIFEKLDFIFTPLFFSIKIRRMLAFELSYATLTRKMNYSEMIKANTLFTVRFTSMRLINVSHYFNVLLTIIYFFFVLFFNPIPSFFFVYSLFSRYKMLIRFLFLGKIFILVFLRLRFSVFCFFCFFYLNLVPLSFFTVNFQCKQRLNKRK